MLHLLMVKVTLNHNLLLKMQKLITGLKQEMDTLKLKFLMQIMVILMQLPLAQKVLLQVILLSIILGQYYTLQVLLRKMIGKVIKLFNFILETSLQLSNLHLYKLYKLWSLRLSVRTPGFQPGKRGSIPLGTTIPTAEKIILIIRFKCLGFNHNYILVL